MESQLGQPAVPSEERRQHLIAAYRRLAHASPQSFPDGVTDRDQFIDYRAGHVGVTLQTRDGRLVNFRPSNYERPLEPVRVLNALK